MQNFQQFINFIFSIFFVLQYLWAFPLEMSWVWIFQCDPALQRSSVWPGREREASAWATPPPGRWSASRPGWTRWSPSATSTSRRLWWSLLTGTGRSRCTTWPVRGRRRRRWRWRWAGTARASGSASSWRTCSTTGPTTASLSDWSRPGQTRGRKDCGAGRCQSVRGLCPSRPPGLPTQRPGVSRRWERLQTSGLCSCTGDRRSPATTTDPASTTPSGLWLSRACLPSSSLRPSLSSRGSRPAQASTSPWVPTTRRAAPLSPPWSSSPARSWWSRQRPVL